MGGGNPVVPTLGDRSPRLEEVLIDLIGVYSTAPTTQLALAARVDDFRLRDLASMIEGRRAVRLRAMRTSGYLIPVCLVPVVFGATRRRGAVAPAGFVRNTLPPTERYEEWADRIEELLADGPLAATDIRKRLVPRETGSGRQ